MRALTSALLLLLAALPDASAWNATGHHMTALIAFNRLSPELQAEVAEVLRAHPRYDEDFAAAMPREVRRGTAAEQASWLFRRASVWPDIVPWTTDEARARFHRGTWHYINLPAWLTDEDRLSMEGQLDHNMSMTFDAPLRAGLNGVQALAGNLAVWRDAEASAAQRAVALCWIVHIAGDLHQPLHTVALFSAEYLPSGDRGGNDIEVKQTPDDSNLHAVWDRLPDGFASLAPSAAATRLLEGDEVSLSAIADWVAQHSDIAQESVYTPGLKSDLERALDAGGPAAVRLSDGYRAHAAAIAQDQVIVAGFRIAALLEP